MADGYAVKELLKIVQLLYEAKTLHGSKESDELSSASLPLDISNKLSQLKTCRSLATEITEKGATLYDLLSKELRLRDLRSNVISRALELPSIESAIGESLKKLGDQVNSTKLGMENLHADETNLLAKIDKKKVELDRAEKRLKSLQVVRPAYMDEYERIEVELVNLYQAFVEKFRNVTFLEQQLDEYNREEQNKMDETGASLKRMQERLREEELRLLRGEKDIDDDVGHSAGSRPQRPAAAGSRSKGLNHQDDDEESDSEAADLDADGLSLGSGMSSAEIFDDDAKKDDVKKDARHMASSSVTTIRNNAVPERPVGASRLQHQVKDESEEELDEDDMDDDGSIDLGEDDDGDDGDDGDF